MPKQTVVPDEALAGVLYISDKDGQANAATLARLRVSLAKEQANYAAEDARFGARNGVLRAAYDRAVKSMSDLQSKAAHFELADEAAHGAMVRGHEEEVGALLARLGDSAVERRRDTGQQVVVVGA